MTNELERKRLISQATSLMGRALEILEDVHEKCLKKAGATERKKAA